MIRNLTHGSLQIQDGTSPTPNSITVACMKGDLKWEDKQESKTVLNRGALFEFTRGEESPCMISFSMAFERVEAKPGDADPTPYEAMTKTGAASAWVSTLANKLNSPHGCRLVFTLQDVEGADADGYNEVLTFEDFVADTKSFSEGDAANEFSISGKALRLRPDVEANATV